ncbi:AAA family ATPase, partial [Acinetobacter seifertii]|uniref:AAA family ATPase n=1 Tax=Acinetobacter seifertii TaxID=1530123 RepID=UPI0011B238FB
MKSLEKLDVFSQKNNIDKTLFFQIELYKNSNTTSDFNKELYTTLKKYIKRDSIRKFDEEINNSLTPNNDHIFFIEKMNSFFRKTNREIKFNTFDNFYYERNNEIIKWYDFSKGEKFLLVQMLLAYNFRKDNCIFLFDEPDSYLHIEWQQMLLTQLKEISPNSTFIIASHSPSLISKETKINFINLNKY